MTLQKQQLNVTGASAGFRTAIFSLSLTVVMIMFVPLLLRERPGERLLPWTSGAVSPDAANLQLGSFAKIFRSLFAVLKLPDTMVWCCPRRSSEGAPELAVHAPFLLGNGRSRLALVQYLDTSRHVIRMKALEHETAAAVVVGDCSAGAAAEPSASRPTCREVAFELNCRA